MTTNTPPGGIETSRPRRGFPAWPGVIVGIGVASGLVGLQLHRHPPDALARLLGGLMAPAHGLVAFAVVTLLGQAFTIIEWDGALVGRRERLTGRRGAEPLLGEPDDVREFRQEVGRTTRGLSVNRRKSGRLGRIVAYAVPLAGFAVSILDPGPGEPSWSVVGQPLFLNLGESLLVLLLTLGVSNSAEVVERGWLSTAAGEPTTGGSQG